MTTLVLCRHGESEGNAELRFGGHSATPLTELGRAQAGALARALAAEGVDVIYTSDLVRAVETARHVADLTGVTPVEEPALRERSVGEMTGLTFAEAALRFPEAYNAMMQRQVDARPPGGETYRECRARVASVLDRVLLTQRGKRIVFVSHNIAMTRLSAHLLRLDDDAGGEQPPRLDNGAMHRFLRTAEGAWSPVAWNECPERGAP